MNPQKSSVVSTLTSNWKGCNAMADWRCDVWQGSTQPGTRRL